MVNNKKPHIDLSPIMSPKSVAVVGASAKPGKVGNAIMQNYIDVGFQGKLYPINVNAADKIMGFKAYKSILDVKEPIDLAVISVPAEIVPKVLEECGKAKARGVVLVTSGFAEVGRIDLQDRIVAISKKYRMPLMGPNCLGVMDTRSRNDTLFLPTSKIDRPKIGGVSFVSQSGSVGSSLLDLISGEGFGLAKFISYGNAAVIDEVDLLDYLAHDKETKVIVYYIEGVKRGKEFVELAKTATKLKPVVILKGGMTPSGASAAHSHTASLAGSSQAYEAVFKQFGFVEAHTLEDLLYFAKIFDTQPLTPGNRVAILTNGGGHGVLATDALYNNGLVSPQLNKENQKALRKIMPSIVNIRLPLDIGGDAGSDRFSAALDALSRDENVDAIMAITLFQTPGADESVANAIVEHAAKKLKPLVAVSTGSTYTRSHVSLMEEGGVPVYDSPDAAAKALAALISYTRYKQGMP
ncbi:MAG: acetate--CoA ligase family protein [Candidatus Marsarchaeota archaeon]|nr:acetate--CoA ligase family protein [Candidatus Marsarchaeota archaeon]MCL5115190.1 acetate--CoA ligase family protein [Candidatus Marsarchaeota archaeon]